MTTDRSPSRASDPGSKVSAFIEALAHPHKPGIMLLREAILSADPRIVEEVKWNAPSFKVQDHFLTFKLFPPKNIQLIFHVGAKPLEPARAFKLDLPPKAIKWAAQDRCVLTIADSKQAEEFAPRGGTAVVVAADKVALGLAQLPGSI